MAISLLNNIASLKSQTGLERNTRSLSETLDRLSSGLRINRASDDAAGLAIADSLRADSRLYTQAIRNTNDGISLLTVTEAALGNLSGIVTRIAELAEQAANGVYNSSQRSALDREAQALRDEYTRIVQTTSFNNIKTLDGSNTNIVIQNGISSSTNSRISFSLGNMLATEQGNGTFSGPTLSVGTGRVKDVAAADFNGDGFDDFVFVGDSGSSTFLTLSNGDGSFKYRTNLGGQGDVIGAGDIDGDGDLDILVDDNSDNIQLFINQGTGTFSNGGVITTPGADSKDVEVGDINGDGLADFIQSDYVTNQASVFLSNGNGTFKLNASYAITNRDEIELIDINSDGKVDMVTSGWSSTMQVRMGDGTGNFGAATSTSFASMTTDTFAGGDFNNDGIVDIAMVGTIGGGSTLTAGILLGNGNGTFKAYSIFNTGQVSSLAGVDDYNNDGFDDVIAIGSGNTFVFLGNGDNTFKAPTTYSSGLAVNTRATSGDFNGDGASDIVFATYNSSTAVVFMGQTSSVNGLADFSLTSQSSAREALDSMNSALSSITSSLSNIGAIVSRLNVSNSLAASARENALSAESRIRDADISSEAANLIRMQILQQSSSAVLAQANLIPKLALSLLS